MVNTWLIHGTLSRKMYQDPYHRPWLPCLGSMLWWNPSLTIRRQTVRTSWGSLGFSWYLLVFDGYGLVKSHKSQDSGSHGVCHCLSLHHRIWRTCLVVTVGNSHSLMVQNPKITSICWLKKAGQQFRIPKSHQSASLKNQVSWLLSSTSRYKINQNQMYGPWPSTHLTYP